MGIGNSRERNSSPDSLRHDLASAETVLALDKDPSLSPQQPPPGQRTLVKNASSVTSMSSLNLPNPSQIPNDCWMERLANVIGPQPLAQIVLPGTHHSGSYSITENSEVGPDAPTLLQGLHPQHTPGGPVAAAWARTQTRDVYTQLDEGIRYLDLRVAFHSSLDDIMEHLFDDDPPAAEGGESHEFEGLFVSHSLLGATVELVLAQIRRWLDAHPRELIVVDFQKFENFDDMAHAKLVGLITDSLSSKMAPASFGPTNTYNELIGRGCQAVVVYGDAFAEGHGLLWPRSKSLFCPEIATHKMDKLESFCNEQLAKRPTDKLFVLEMALTPSPDTIVDGDMAEWPGLQSLESLAGKVTPQAVGWLSNMSKRVGGLNVVSFDHYSAKQNDSVTLVDTVKRLNLQFPFYSRGSE
eukprot:TRINITY_DN8227_c0_g1_i1.p1 TRINITY_DN8227_c0_g1~~TRINITY_DN8227_c0_g1_i1.p1  ORF type:complete len:411 (-),score=103.73 TRINITY_DN8227_c0_g1_i1:636-1868(-)